MALEIDHLIQCVPDLEEAAIAVKREHGLSTVVGGRHSGHGTANILAPLGSAYLELISVVDEEEAESSALAHWVRTRFENPGFDAICLRTDDIDGVAGRLGVTPSPMSRTRPDGARLDWRLAGMESMLTDGLPFFIQWDIDERLHPARADVRPPNPVTGFDSVIISGSVARLDSWVGACEGLAWVEGPPGIVSVVVQSVDLA